MEHQGVVKLYIMEDNEKLCLGKCTIEPVQLGQEFVFAYVISGDAKKTLVLMDELKGWQPPDKLRETPFDLVYLPFGIFNNNPVTKEKVYPDDYFLYEEKATIEETLGVIRKDRQEHKITWDGMKISI